MAHHQFALAGAKSGRIKTTRIPRIECVPCLKHQPFDMKKEKKKHCPYNRSYP